MKKNKITLLGVLLILGLSWVFLPFSLGTFPPKANQEVQFIYASDQDPTLIEFIDPHASFRTSMLELMEPVTETLFWMDPDDPEFPNTELSGLLAEDYEWLDDLTCEITLKDGINFSDGTDFDAEAVEWNMERLWNINHYHDGVLLSAWQLPAEIFREVEGLNLDWVPEGAKVDVVNNTEVVDDTTIRFNLNIPFADLIPNLQDIRIVSPTAHSEYLNATIDSIDEYPIGTGPFILEDLSVILGEAQFEPNPEYWKEAPVIDSIIIRYITDTTQRHTALISGQMDYMLNPVQANLEGYEEEVNVTEKAKYGYYLHHFSLYDSIPLAVRKALSYAFDYQYFCDVVQDGSMVKAGGVVGKYQQYYNESIPIAYRNLTIARQALIDGGIAPAEAVNWTDSQWELRAIDDPLAEYEFIEIAGISIEIFNSRRLLLTRNAQEIGIKITQKLIELNDFLDGFYNQTLHEFGDIFQDTYDEASEKPSPSTQLQNWFLSSGWLNEAEVNDTEIDNWIYDYFRTVDREERQEAVNKIANKHQNELYRWLFAADQLSFYAFSTDWTIDNTNQDYWWFYPVDTTPTNGGDGQRAIDGFAYGILAVSSLIAIAYIWNKKHTKR